MTLQRRSLLRSSAVLAALPGLAIAEAKAPIRIGVVSDMSGPFADFGGPGVVIAARLAAEEFTDGALGRHIEILSGDHQNKPDIASAIARQWIDSLGVDAIVESGHSGCALALQDLMRRRNRVFMITGAST